MRQPHTWNWGSTPRCRGVFAVEMAIILPCLVAVMAGIAILGQACWKYVAVKNVTTNGARWIAQSSPVEMRDGVRIEPAKAMMRQALLDAGITGEPNFIIGCKPSSFCNAAPKAVVVELQVTDPEPNFLFQAGLTINTLSIASYGN